MSQPCLRGVYSACSQCVFLGWAQVIVIINGVSLWHLLQKQHFTRHHISFFSVYAFRDHAVDVGADSTPQLRRPVMWLILWIFCFSWQGPIKRCHVIWLLLRYVFIRLKIIWAPKLTKGTIIIFIIIWCLGRAKKILDIIVE